MAQRWKHEPGASFIVALPRRGGYGVLVTAGIDRSLRPHMSVYYGFGPRHQEPPTGLREGILPSKAMLIVRGGVPTAMEDGWIRIKNLEPFRAAEWSEWVFKRWDRHARRFLRIEYDPSTMKSKDAIGVSDEEAACLHWDGVCTTGAIRYELDDAIDACEHARPFVPAGPVYLRPPPERVLPCKRQVVGRLSIR